MPIPVLEMSLSWRDILFNGRQVDLATKDTTCSYVFCHARCMHECPSWNQTFQTDNSQNQQWADTWQTNNTKIETSPSCDWLKMASATFSLPPSQNKFPLYHFSSARRRFPIPDLHAPLKICCSGKLDPSHPLNRFRVCKFVAYQGFFLYGAT